MTEKDQDDATAALARRDAEVRKAALREALEHVRELYITADNDREEGRCEGVSAAEAAILALIEEPAHD